MNDRMPDGTPFYVLDTERQFIGLVLMCEEKDVLAVNLDRHDFHDRSLGVVWAAVQEAARKGAAGLPYVAYLLDQAGVLEQVGSETRLAELMGNMLRDPLPVYSYYLEPHAEIIRDWGERRKGLENAQILARHAMSGTHRRTPVWDRPEYQGELS